MCRSANKNRSNADDYTEVKTKTVSVQIVHSLLCLQTCMRKLGPIIYSRDHSVLSKLAFLVDSIKKKKKKKKKKKDVQGKKTFKSVASDLGSSGSLVTNLCPFRGHWA